MYEDETTEGCGMRVKMASMLPTFEEPAVAMGTKEIATTKIDLPLTDSDAPESVTLPTSTDKPVSIDYAMSPTSTSTKKYTRKSTALATSKIDVLVNITLATITKAHFRNIGLY